MQGGRDPFFGRFGDPFGNVGAFGGFGDPFGNVGAFGGFGGQRSLMSRFFGGTDPFDDTFFMRPFESMFNPSFIGSAGHPFMNPQTSGFRDYPVPQPNGPNLARRPVIVELDSDEEKDEKEGGEERKENPRKHTRSSEEPIVEDPDDGASEKKSKHPPRRNDINRLQQVRSQPQAHSFTFHSSIVSYGGANGSYYTSSTTRRSGSDGLTYEECKEADSSTGQALHRVSRGIHDKGHSVTRKLKSDGHVDTMQTLRNLNEDELVGFEEAWRGNARKNLPGWSEKFSAQHVMGPGSSSNSGGWETEHGNGMGTSHSRLYGTGPSNQASRR